jgi:hypothetical protein
MDGLIPEDTSQLSSENDGKSFFLISGREGGSVSCGRSCCGAPSEGSRRNALGGGCRQGVTFILSVNKMEREDFAIY